MRGPQLGSWRGGRGIVGSVCGSPSGQQKCNNNSVKLSEQDGGISEGHWVKVRGGRVSL